MKSADIPNVTPGVSKTIKAHVTACVPLATLWYNWAWSAHIGLPRMDAIPVWLAFLTGTLEVIWLAAGLLAVRMVTCWLCAWLCR